MRTRTKHEKLEKQRKTFFMIGVILALAVVFTAFEWRTYDVSYDLDLTNHGWDFFEEEDVDPTKHEKKELPKPIIKPIAAINEIDNDKDADEVELFFPETDQMEEIPEFIYTPPEEDVGADEKVIFKIVEDMPEFPGGEKALFAYLVSKARFTQWAIETGVDGTVYVEFVVEKDGSVSNVRSLRLLGAGLDEVAVEAVKGMPRWTPGKQRKVPVRVTMVVPFNFKLN